ncbi:hypothetical protein TTHERM_00753610 (macronuclear) [Tetrahymena thermophila SB210]|uniref:Transmembrane protein n=1 Tax=Tetrahymena thermophila (strain SB210) TaxID=312017 RepID=Q23NG3_TETTS|nr:hypothetical protein TTHERM_00753610 [Tetrahymena thermophila SB210]EAR98111.1 hypothetical protein TTHERM_00753610 [Tetrahymena thermophila SB210]|eukprot:XP_001018356.1 hypothetical protein TTHERM_00753610 [Tetrahymena thermophila SB210]
MRRFVFTLLCIISLTTIKAQFDEPYEDILKVLACLQAPEVSIQCENTDQACIDEMEQVILCSKNCNENPNSFNAVAQCIKSQCKFKIQKIQASIDKQVECMTLFKPSIDHQGQLKNQTNIEKSIDQLEKKQQKDHQILYATESEQISISNTISLSFALLSAFLTILF